MYYKCDDFTNSQLSYSPVAILQKHQPMEFILQNSYVILGIEPIGDFS